MEMLLVLVTAGALATAGLMGVLLFRTVRDERRRSEARIEALRAAAIGERSPAAVHQTRAAEVGDLFVEPERASPWLRRLGVAAVIALLSAGAAFVLLSSRAGGTRTADIAEADARQPVPGASLELLSLRDTQQDKSITITGLVQNPKSAPPVSLVTATAFVFGTDGLFLASGRAPLDFSTLGPGDESPFVITIPVSATVSRYRVGFRDADGRVIAHVDRRTNATVASR